MQVKTLSWPNKWDFQGHIIVEREYVHYDVHIECNGQYIMMVVSDGIKMWSYPLPHEEQPGLLYWWYETIYTAEKELKSPSGKFTHCSCFFSEECVKIVHPQYGTITFTNSVECPTVASLTSEWCLTYWPMIRCILDVKYTHPTGWFHNINILDVWDKKELLLASLLTLSDCKSNPKKNRQVYIDETILML